MSLTQAFHGTPLSVDTYKFVSGFPRTLFYVPFSFADFNRYPFPVINPENNSFSEFLESLQKIIEPKYGLEDLQ